MAKKSRPQKLGCWRSVCLRSKLRVALKYSREQLRRWAVKHSASSAGVVLGWTDRAAMTNLALCAKPRITHAFGNRAPEPRVGKQDHMRVPPMAFDTAWIVPLLSLFTLLAVCVFALVSKARTEERKHDPSAPKSTLAKDGPQGGVDMLM